MTQIRCFVAMAFGRQDTDALYSKAIAPVLRSVQVTPIRVDLREHNRNVNDVIMRELQRADLLLADLTYARPSVYFEAGYAERQVPVIYAVRADHLPGTATPDENHRVHFDVAMRNIIRWFRPDEQFKGRLTRRLRHVLAPIRARRRAAQERKRLTRSFTALSSSEQVAHLQTALVMALGFSDFKMRPLYGDRNPLDPRDPRAWFSTPKGQKACAPPFVFVRIVQKRLSVIALLTVPHTSSQKLFDLLQRWDLVTMMWSMKDDYVKRHVVHVGSIEEHIVIASPARLDFQAVKRHFLQARSEQSTRSLTWNPGPAAGYIGFRGTLTRRVHFMDNVRAPSIVVEELVQRLFLRVRHPDQIRSILDKSLSDHKPLNLFKKEKVPPPQDRRAGKRTEVLLGSTNKYEAKTKKVKSGR